MFSLFFCWYIGWKREGVVYEIKQMGNNHQKNIENLSDFDKSETMKQYMRLYKLY